MRKISKSRTEDDTVSSTNGSINNEEADTAESKQDSKNDDNDNSADEAHDDEDSSSSSPKNNKKGKSKASKKKKKDTSKKGAKSEDADEEYEVEKIVDSKKIKGKLHYLIRWKGYSSSSDSWEPAHTLSCPDLINKYNEEKENSSDKEIKSPGKKGKKRKASKEPKPSKRPKNEWDSENADENAEYEVERILEVHHKKTGKREFLIHWKGWSSKFDSWEPESNLNCPELIKKFMDKVSSARSTDSRNLRVAPGTTNRFTLQVPGSGRRLSKRGNQRQRVRYDNAE